MLGLGDPDSKGDYELVTSAVDSAGDALDDRDASLDEKDERVVDAPSRPARTSRLAFALLGTLATVVGLLVGSVGTHFVDLATLRQLPARVWTSHVDPASDIDATKASLSDFLPNITYVISAKDTSTFNACLKRNHIAPENAIQLTCGITPGLEDCVESHKTMSCKLNRFYHTTKIEFSNSHWFVKLDEDVRITPHLYEVIAELAACNRPMLQMWSTFMSKRFRPYPHGPIYAGNVLPQSPDSCVPEDVAVGKTAPDDLDVYDAGLLVEDAKYGYERNGFCWFIASHGEMPRKKNLGSCVRTKPRDICGSVMRLRDLRELWYATSQSDKTSRMIKRHLKL